MSKLSTKTINIAAPKKVTISIPILLVFFFAMLISVATAQPLAAQQKPALQPGRAGNASQQMVGDFSATLKKYEKQIHFTENKGQWDNGVLFKADFIYGQAIAMPKGMMMSSFDPASVGARSTWMMEQEEAKHEHKPFNKPMPALKGHAWMMNFVGASSAMKIESKDAHGDLANYFLGNKQATDVRSFNEVWYNNVYDNIDVRYYPSAEGALEYDIIANPGSNPSKIAIKFDGIEKLELANGHLVLHTTVGKMDLPEPYAYQTINGKEVKVEATYALNANNELTFALGKYNTAYPLVIDPIAMRWATWMTQNSASDNHGHCIWVDGSGNIYVVSRFTGAGLIVTPGAFASSAIGDLDMNVGKYTEPTSVGGQGTRIWQTYLGGEEGDENPYVAEMGPDGNLYIAGYTTSDNFPLLGGSAFSGASLDARSQSSDNCFVIKINPAGNSIKGAVIGGNGNDDIYDLRITATGDIILGGLTTSTNLSSQYSGSGASNTNNGSNDFWMFKINQNLSSMTWMKNYGGSGSDQINILNIQSSTGDIYAGGSTSSSSLSLVSARQNTKVGGTVGYLQKTNAAGTIQWSSYFNSSGNSSSSVNTSILCMELNTAQNAFYFGGMTGGLANSNISSGVYDNSFNGSSGRDFFVAKMALDQTFAYATYVGSTDDEDNMMGLNVDANDDVYIFGYTYADNSLFPTAGDPLQSANQGGTSGRDKVFFKLETDLSALLYSTYYGGSADDSDPVGQRGIKFSNCRIYTIVTARSNNIPLTVGALNTSKSSSTSIYEPAVIVWANPPDLGNNTISSNQYVCNGAQPVQLTGPVPVYELPTITRNGTTSTYPALTTAIAYQWQSSTDQTTWTNIPGATGQNLTSAQMGNMTQTTYYRRIFNGDACVLNNGNSVVTAAVFRLSGTVTNNTCFGGTSGAINVTASGNAPGSVTYSWSDGPTSEDRTGLAAGTYTVTATAANGCTFTQSFTITQPTQISFTATPSNATCGSSNGSISVSGVSGGSGAGYTYSRDGVSYQAGTSFSGLAGGSYTIYVKDGAGCVRSQQVTVGSVNLLTVSVQTQTDVSCFNGNDGSVTLSGNGGSTPYQYSKDGITFQAGATFSGLTAGSYTITIKDANGCTATTIVSIGQPASAVSVSLQSTVNASCGGSNGSITVVGNGGTPAYTYSKDGITYQAGNTFSGLAGGSYTITIKDAKGCTASISATVGNHAGPSASIGAVVDAACYADASGSVTVNGSGGTAPLQYSIDGVNFQPSAVFNGLAAGVYTFTVKDANGCTATAAATVGQPQSPLTVSVGSQTNVACYGDATGSVTLIGSGGTPGYTYSIDGVNFQTSPIFNGLAFGQYGFVVKDTKGCIAFIGAFVDQPLAPLTASIDNVKDVDCFGNASGSVLVVAQGGTAAYQYQLGNGAFQPTGAFSGLSAGNYVVNVKDANNCTTSVNVTINQPAAPLAVSISGFDNVCPTFTNGSATAVATGGTTNYTYTWNTVPSQSGATATGLGVGTYTVNVVDANGCRTSTTVTISNNPKPLAGGDFNICEKVAQLPAAGQGESWALASGPANASVNNAGAVSGMNVGGTYMFILTNQYGCSDTALVVTTANCPLIANPDNASTNEDQSVTIPVPSNDVDPDGNIDNGSVVVVTPPANGSVVVNNDGSITYTPNANYNGPDSFIYNICDTGMPVYCDTALVTINVIPVNDPPVANQDNASTPEDQPVTINVPGNDTDLDGNLDNGSVTITDQPNNGSVTVNPNGSIIYTPNPDFNGVDTLIYQICDTGMPVLCDTALVVINVTPVNDPPIANEDNASTQEEQPVTINVPVNDTDVDGNLDNGSVTIVTPPVNGSVSVNPNGSIIYTPNSNFNGVDSLIYNICDTGMPVLCDTAWVYINVDAVNDPPVANLDTVSTPEDTPVVIDVPSNDTDPDGNLDSTSVTVVTPPNHGSTTVDSTGNIIYTPDPNYNGPDTLLYQICDTGMPVLCDTALVVINVTPVNDPPIAVVDTAYTNEDVVIDINVDINDYDIDGNLDTNTVVIIIPPVNGNASYVDSTGIIHYVPAPNFCGIDSLQYAISDSLGLSDSAWVYIYVRCVPDLTVDPNVFPSGTNISCFGANDGSIDLTIDSGTPPYTISWTGPNGFTSNLEDISGLAPGTYTVIVTDGNNNSDTATVTLTEPTQLASTIAAQVYNGGFNISCAGSCDGAANLTVSGGSAPYSYVWTGPNGFTSQQEDISALCGGTYYVTITDLNGCSLADTVTLSQPDSLQAVGVAATYQGGANVSCQNACDGSIDLSVNGGSQPYSFAWTGPNGFVSQSEDLSGLCAGTYNVVVTDANGCSTSYIITLTPPTVVDGSINPVAFAGGVNVSCAGACDGAVDLAVSGGAAPYSFAWTGPNGFASQSEDLSGLCAGTYTVIITDLNGCTATESVTLVAPTPVNASAVAATYNGGVNVSCAGSCDGAINLTPSGGVGPYTFIWTGPNGFASQLEDLSGLCAGTYNVIVTDANGCTATTSITLTAPAPVSLATIVPIFTGEINVSCANACDGAVNLTVSGGVGPFSYSWVGPNGFAAQTEDLNNICVGTYTVTVTDANGCTSSTSVTLVGPTPVSAVAIAATYAGGVNVSCAGACDGAINLNPSGGISPYTFSWVGPNGFASQLEDLSGLCVGTYTVTVTDLNGCTATTSVTLTAPTQVSAVAVAATYQGGVNVSCANACDGSINLTPSGGIAPYSYSWVGPNGFASQLEDLSGLCAGTYTVTVTDANGCTASTSVTLTAPTPLSGSAVAATFNGGYNVSCSGACDGSVNLTVTGGTAPYSYSWVGAGYASQVEDAQGLCSGSYTVTITDANGCTTTVTIDISSPQPVSGQSSFTVDQCGQGNGSATIVAAGGDGNYSYAWVDGAGAPVGGNAATISGLAGGSYTVTITDGNNCTTSVTIVVPATEPVQAAGVVTNVSCNSACNGAIDIELLSGTFPFTYTWSGPNGYSSSLESITGICPGNYTVAISDSNNCAASYNFTVTEPTAIAISVSSNSDATCQAANGSASVSVVGGTGSYDYLWTGGATTPSINNVASGQYTIQVTDDNGCVASLEVNIGSQSNLVLTTDVTNVSCNGLSNGAIDLTVSGAVNPTFAWTVPATTEDVDSLAPGTYVVYVTDDNGCEGWDTVAVNQPDAIIIAAADIVTYPNGYNVSGPLAEDGSIDITVEGGSAPYTYLWNPSGNADAEDQFDMAADTYTVVITDANGCVLTEEYILEGPPLVELPTGFSPDGDGKNDYYVIHGIEKLLDNQFTVFNRWGQVVFDKKGYQNDWAGTNYQGSPMPDGTYFILFTVNIPGIGEQTYKVTVELRANFSKK